MTVRRWSRGPASTPIGKPAVHPAIVDLKGKAYEYVFVAHLTVLSDAILFACLNFGILFLAVLFR